jgi:hypothetical protein
MQYSLGVMFSRSFFEELKRRRVYRVALVYGVFCFAMIQVGGTILPIFHARLWCSRFSLC